MRPNHLWVWCASTALIGCNSILGASDYHLVGGGGSATSVAESTAATGTGGAGGADLAWSCLPSFMTPTPTDMVSVAFQLVMADGSALPSDIQIKLCSSFDTLCANPVDSNVMLDEQGMHTFVVGASFGNGFLEISSPSQAVFPSLAYFGTPVEYPQATTIVRLTTTSELTGLLNVSNHTFDPDHGMAIILTSDCLDHRTAGVSLSSPNGDAMTVPFYFKGNLPVAESADSVQTDVEGAGGFLNLPPIIVSVDTTRHSDGSFIGTSSFQVRKQTITYVPIGPTTKP